MPRDPSRVSPPHRWSGRRPRKAGSYATCSSSRRTSRPPSALSAARGCTTSRGPRNGGPSTRTPAAHPRPSPCCVQRMGQYVYNADEVPLGWVLPPDHAALRAAQPVRHGQPPSPGESGGRQGRCAEGGMAVRPGCSAQAPPQGGRIHRRTWNQIIVAMPRASNTYLRSVSGEPEETDVDQYLRRAVQR